MVILMITFFSLLRFDFQDLFLNEVHELMGVDAAQIFESIINAANRRPDLSAEAGWVGVGILAFSASVIFIKLQSALNIIFKAKIYKQHSNSRFHFIKDFILRRLFSIGILLTLIFIFISISIVSLSISAMLSYFMKN